MPLDAIVLHVPIVTAMAVAQQHLKQPNCTAPYTAAYNAVHYHTHDTPPHAQPHASACPPLPGVTLFGGLMCHHIEALLVLCGCLTARLRQVMENCVGAPDAVLALSSISQLSCLLHWSTVLRRNGVHDPRSCIGR